MRQNKGYSALHRQEAVGMNELVTQFINEMKLASGLKKQRVAEVWNEVSGAGRYTLDVKFDKRVLTCVISSSVVRNQLYFQRDVLVGKMNELLSKDILFDENDGIKTLILK